ncbi:hypothetical protein D3C76_1132180 [compost metagenome]
MPAASLRVTCKGLPVVCALGRVIWNWPLWLTVPVARIAPLASRTVTVAPASPWPLTTVAALFRLRPVAAFGACRSNACWVAASEVLPAASAWVTVRVWPLAWGGTRLTLNSPLLPTVAVPSTVPCASTTRTVAPTSPWPVRVVPLRSRPSWSGASGAVLSAATMVAGTESLPSSEALTCSVCALSWALLKNTRNVPSLPTVAVPSVMPPEVTVISEPTVPSPVSRKPSALICRSVGVATSVPSGPLRLVGVS